MTATIRPARRGLLGSLRDIYHERTHFDFIGKSWLWALLSGGAVTVAAAALLLSGLNLGIDFQGGRQWEFNVSRTVDAGQVRDALKGSGIKYPKILILGNGGVRVQSLDLKHGDQVTITKTLARFAGIPASKISLSQVGPTWGDRVSSKAELALVAFFVLIASYLTFRFEFKMAVAAIIAVIHDIIITVGVYAITGFEVTPGTVVAFLTILGFSLYDTVVVFDKIGENTASLGVERGDTYSRMVNRSMNAVLMRSINTSFVALLPVASLLFVGSGILGAVTLRDFALALFVGLMVGAYSSIFVATPILAWMKEREPRNRALRVRSTTQLARGEPVIPAMAAPVAVTSGNVGAVGSPDAPAPSSAPPPGTPAPRPRQQRGKRRRR